MQKMAIQMQNYETHHLLNTQSPEKIYTSPPRIPTRASPSQPPALTSNALIKSILRDNKDQLITTLTSSSSSSSSLTQPLDRALISKLLHLACELDSSKIATCLINGEINGVVPLINERDEGTGYAPIHTAAQNHSLKCVEVLIRKRARTEMKTKNVKAKLQLLPLEVALYSAKMEVDWGPNESLNDLLLQLTEKDLSVVKLLAEKTEVGEVAYALAIKGRVTLLAALLMVAADRVNRSVLELRTDTELAAEKTTVYYCVIREAISIYSRLKGASLGPHEKDTDNDKDIDGVAERRNLLLKEIELLHFFGAPYTFCGDKKVTSPLILASQAGDAVVMEVLLKTNIDVNETDAEGNSALHWCLKASKVPTPEQIRILSLLLNHGAQVRQRNMLGLTSVHIAASNGNLEALEILLTQDPSTVHSASEFRETPLFSAAKNDFIECAQLLLRFGAGTDVRNLRRERPIDVAKSQNMRSALDRTSVIITNRTSQQKYTAHVHNNDVVSETCKMLLKDTHLSSDSTSSGSDNDICKYYTSSTGCVRGSKCFYKHGEEEPLNPKSRVGSIRSTALADFKKKVFVGGLPPAMDADSLASIFEEQFGPVVDAKVLETEIGGQVTSRGFGFVTFKHEKSVTDAVEVHYLLIWGKKAEIKSAVPKCLLSHEGNSNECEQQLLEQDNFQLIGRSSKQSDKTEGEGMGEDIPEDELKPLREPSLLGDESPLWFTTFKKWLPKFLRKMSTSAREGEFYSLSSLKADFKAIFGVELDHTSLGYPKLSDFIKSLPGLCSLKVVHTGGHVANHMILLPRGSRPPPLIVPKREALMSSPVTPVQELKDDSATPVSHKFAEEPMPSPCGSNGDTLSKNSFEFKFDFTGLNKVNAEMSLGTPTSSSESVVLPHHRRLVQFFEPDPIFLGRKWLGTGGFKEPDEPFRSRHFVLEALALKRKEVFFLRGPNFYSDYAATLKQGDCFGCKKKKMIWVNHPCQHLLWCSDCRNEVLQVAAVATSSHKCVLCDHMVQGIHLITWSKRQQHVNNDFDFASIYTSYHREKIPT